MFKKSELERLLPEAALRNELVAGQLMLAYVELGRRMDALNVYHGATGGARAPGRALPAARQAASSRPPRRRRRCR